MISEIEKNSEDTMKKNHVKLYQLTRWDSRCALKFAEEQLARTGIRYEWHSHHTEAGLNQPARTQWALFIQAHLLPLKGLGTKSIREVHPVYG